MVGFDHAKHVVFDFETSGVNPDYALQPWRIPSGDAWATSLVSLRHIEGKNTFGGGLAPSKHQMKEMLEDAIHNKLTLLGWNTQFDVQILMAYGLVDLAMQCKFLDGMLLWRHLTIEPEYDMDRSKKQSYSLKTWVREAMPQYGGYENEVDYHDPSPEMRAKLHKYNKQDNVFTLIASTSFYEALEPQQLRAAQIEAKCIPLVAHANLKGLLVDTLSVRDLRNRLIKDAEVELENLAPHGVTETIIRSPMQLAKLLYDVWELPVLKENKSKKTGNTTRSTDKEVLHELAFIDPRASSLKRYREALNNATKFCQALLDSIDYNGDHCTHPQALIFGTYCVTGDVEVMTREGWVRLDQWTGGEIVQVKPDLTMEFLPATRFIGPITDEWVRLKQQSFDCLFTPGHTVPYLAQKTFQWRTQKAGELSGEVKYIPTAGKLTLTGQYTPDQMRLFVAIQADGYSVDKHLKFTLKKKRKVIKLIDLLTVLDIQHHVYIRGAYPDRIEVTVAKSYRPDWCGHDKKFFGPWILNTSPEGLEAFLTETEFWDGSAHADGGFTYGSNIKENVEWVVTVASLVGRKAAIHATNKHGMVVCHISPPHIRATRAITPRYRSIVTEAHRAYCATTETGFWLARSNGHIFVTGNTSRLTYSSKQSAMIVSAKTGNPVKGLLPIGFAIHQMKGIRKAGDEAFRGAIVAPPNHVVMEFDAAGQEFRWMAIQSNDQVMLQLCLPGEDPHSFMGSRVIHCDYHDMIRLKETDKVMKAGRKAGKVANLALQFRTSPPRLMTTARVDYDMPMELPEAKLIHHTYVNTYKGVPVYWYKSIGKTRRLGYAETMAGRRVQVKGDWKGKMAWAMESTAINYPIQGTGGDQKYLALACLRNYIHTHGIHFVWDLHDGLYFFVPLDKVQRAAVDMKYILDNLPYKDAWNFTPPIPLTWDCKVGPSWGALKDYHP